MSADRDRRIWLMRKSGMTYAEIGAEMGIHQMRARQIAIRADRRMAAACEKYDEPVTDETAYGVWHTFTFDWRNEPKRDGLLWMKGG